MGPLMTFCLHHQFQQRQRPRRPRRRRVRVSWDARVSAADSPGCGVAGSGEAAAFWSPERRLPPLDTAEGAVRWRRRFRPACGVPARRAGRGGRGGDLGALRFLRSERGGLDRRRRVSAAAATPGRAGRDEEGGGALRIFLR